MPRRKGGKKSRRSGNQTSVSSVLVRDVSNSFSAAGTVQFNANAVGNIDTAVRATSARLMFSSATPVWWQVRAYSSPTGIAASVMIVFESPKFTTCGNSITRSFRCSRNTPYSTPDGVRWQVTCSGVGMVVGTATFSTRGPITPDESDPAVELVRRSEYVYEYEEEDSAPEEDRD